MIERKKLRLKDLLACSNTAKFMYIGRTPEVRDSACCGDASDWKSTSLPARFEATKTPCLQSRPCCKLAHQLTPPPQLATPWPPPALIVF